MDLTNIHFVKSDLFNVLIQKLVHEDKRQYRVVQFCEKEALPLQGLSGAPHGPLAQNCALIHNIMGPPASSCRHEPTRQVQLLQCTLEASNTEVHA
uniref:Uncharacterized protein n=1 Tax=Oncorhynchus tshawytscha TaxID=74940 RepID=A0AAZ3PDQ0_ONCTS